MSTRSATLGRDSDLQDIVTLNLTRAVQLCVDLGAHLIADLDVPPPDTMGQTFDALAHAGVIHGPLANSSRRQWAFGISSCITMRKSTGQLSTGSP
jgi:uncharacterized protein YutE (UPF0331/DUF86 family)